MTRTHLMFCTLILVALAGHSAALADHFAVLRPSPHMVTDSDASKVDISIAFAQPSAQIGHDMDTLQMFAVLRYPAQPGDQIIRHDLLENLEEAKYLDKKSWRTEIDMSEPGMYQLVLETRPYWEEQRGVFIQQFAQALVPVLGAQHGWESPVGLKMEILPLTRPFGMVAPALFTGRILREGQTLPNTLVHIEYLNEDGRIEQSPYHQTQSVRSNEQGLFSFVCPYPGWWGFAAVTGGDPLKGPDGQAKRTELSGVLWLKVDPQPEIAPKSQKKKSPNKK